MKKVLLSGIKPTGDIHLGNYFGAIKQFVELASEYETRVFVADLHALTSVNDRDALSQNIINQVKTYLACGLNPEEVTLFQQSAFPEIAEIGWTFNCLTSMPQLMRAHSFKDAEAKDKDINVGVFTYPLLMAADILVHDADIVPVGKDQAQHVEMARDAARKFNQTFGDTFKEPQGKFVKETETVPGIDGQKMSKSYGNVIPLFADKEEIEKLVMKIPTDSAALEDSKNPDENHIYNIHKLVINSDRDAEVRAKYLDGGMGYKEAKDMLIEDLEAFIAPIREKFNSISDSDVKRVLEEGNTRIRPIIEAKLQEVKTKTGLSL